MSRLGQVDIDKSYGLLTEKIVEALQFLKSESSPIHVPYMAYTAVDS